MAVSIAEARHVARLARLGLSDKTLEMLAAELSTVLEHFESLAEFAAAPAAGQVPDALRGDTSCMLRADRVGDSLTVHDALGNAHATERGQFTVPGFLPDEP